MYKAYIINPMTRELFMDAQMQVMNYNIKEDICDMVTSTIELVSIPNICEIGMVLGVMDNFITIYQGIITDLNYESNIVTTKNMISLFNTDTLWYNDLKYFRQSNLEYVASFVPASPSFMQNENRYKKIYGGDGRGTYRLTSTTYESKFTGDLEVTTVNGAEYLIDMYNKYGILMFVYYPITDETSEGGTRKDFHNAILNTDTYAPWQKEIAFSDNTNVIKNITITKAPADYTNIFIADATAIDSIWDDGKLQSYAILEDGTLRSTDIPSDVYVKAFKNIVVIIDPDDYSLGSKTPQQKEEIYQQIATENVSQNIYNHSIEFDLLYNNKMFKIDMLSDYMVGTHSSTDIGSSDGVKLGQKVKLYFNGKRYESVLTGYQMQSNTGDKPDVIHLTFGKARLSLESWLQRGN